MGKYSELADKNNPIQVDYSCTDAAYSFELEIKHSLGEIDELTEILRHANDPKQKEMYLELISMERKKLDELLVRKNGLKNNKECES